MLKILTIFNLIYFIQKYWKKLSSFYYRWTVDRKGHFNFEGSQHRESDSWQLCLIHYKWTFAFENVCQQFTYTVLTPKNKFATPWTVISVYCRDSRKIFVHSPWNKISRNRKFCQSVYFALSRIIEFRHFWKLKIVKISLKFNLNLTGEICLGIPSVYVWRSSTICSINWVKNM